MTVQILFCQEAEADLNEAYDWYERQNTGLGDDFLLCAEAALKQIERNPKAFQTVHRNVRRALLRRFPYGIFYIFSKTNIIVVAIFGLARPAVSSDEYLILFPSAFAKPGDIPRILAHELAHFLIENEWSSRFKEFKRTAGWDSTAGRKGGFVEADGKSSPEEDFANNIEFYLFERSTLKTQSPEIYGWIEKNMRAILQLEKGCTYAK